MKGRAVKTIVLALLSVGFVLLTAFHSVFEDIQAIFSIFFSGSVTQGVPLTIFNYTSHFLLSEVYMKMYLLIPGIPWFEIAMYFYASASLLIVLQLLLKKNGSVLLNAIIIILILFFFSELTVIFQYTRIAFALGAASTLLLLTPREKLYDFLASLLFIIAALTRWEAGLMVLAIQWLVTLFMPSRDLRKPALWVNTVTGLLLVGYIAYDRATTTEYTRQFQPELGYQLLDRGNIVPLGGMTNAVDSAKYRAVLELISDPGYISIDFLKSLVKENAYTGFNQELILRCARLMGDITREAAGFCIIFCSLLGLVLHQRFKNDRSLFWRITLFNATVWLMILVITYYIKMEARVFNPVIILMCILLLSQIDFSITDIHASIFLIPVILGAVLQFTCQRTYASALLNETASNNLFRKSVIEKCSNRIIVPDIQFSQNILYYTRPMQVPDYTALQRLYLFDFDVLYLEREYNVYLRKECHCNADSYTDVMDFFQSKKDRLLFISEPERILAITDYCRIVRNRVYGFNMIDSIEGGGKKAFIYALN